MAVERCPQCEARIPTEPSRCTRCSIARPARRGAGGRPVLFFLILVGLTAGALSGCDSGQAGDSGSTSGAESPENRSILAPRVIACRRSGDSLVTEGSLRNGSQILVRYVEVGASWLDAAGDTVDSAVLEVVGGETLMAGDSVPFHGATANPQATDCRVSLFTYDAVP